MSGCEAQRLIALSLGKIALSRQQRGGINLHKNLLVATVLHKARTTYMMDNFQTLIANRKAQAEREAAAKMVVDAPVVLDKKQMDNNRAESTSDSNDEQVVPCSRGVTDSGNRVNGVEVPSGECPDTHVSSSSDKENSSPKYEHSSSMDNKSNPLACDETLNTVSSTTNKRLCDRDVPVVTGKQPLSEHNMDSEQNQLSSCRCTGGKRRRSCMDFCDSVVQAKRARLSEDYDSCDSDSESEFDPVDATDYESMQTETTQVTNLVDIFNSGFSGLYKDSSEHSSDNSNTGHTGQINVYVSADRPISGPQFVLKDVSCAKQMKDNVANIPTAIALAV